MIKHSQLDLPIPIIPYCTLGAHSVSIHACTKNNQCVNCKVWEWVVGKQLGLEIFNQGSPHSDLWLIFFAITDWTTSMDTICN